MSERSAPAEPAIMSYTSLILALLLAIPAVLVYRKLFSTPDTPAAETSTAQTEANAEEKPKTIMQPARTDLAPPKDDPFTLEELKEFDGSDPSRPIYVAIKGA